MIRKAHPQVAEQSHPQNLQLNLYSYRTFFSQRLDVNVKTGRNKVSSGQFPPPVKTAFGPRFTDWHIAHALSIAPEELGLTQDQIAIIKHLVGGEWFNEKSATSQQQTRRRGRPRIAKQSKDKGVRNG